MFALNDDFSIYCTRGDYCNIHIPHRFNPGDVVRFKAFRKNDCGAIVIQRDFTIDSATDNFVVSLTGTDTKIGEVISKPVDYWYEVQLNPETSPQTIIGYDDNGAKVFRLFPKSKDVDAEDIEVVGAKTLQELVDYALLQAKESGEFKGDKGEDAVGAVLYMEQELSPEQQAQARKNIGVASGSDTKAFYYASFSQAVADINAETTENADAAEEIAVCSVHTDSSGTMHLTLLQDIELNAAVTFAVAVHFDLNGHTINYTGDYGIDFQSDAESCCCNGFMKMDVDTLGTVNMLQLKSGSVVGVSAKVTATSITGLCQVISVISGKVIVDNCDIDVSADGTVSYVGSYAINSASGAALTVKNTNILMKFTGMPLAVAIRAAKTAGNTDIDNCQVKVECESSASVIQVTGEDGKNKDNNISDTKIEAFSQLSYIGLEVDKTNIAISNTSSYIETASANGGIGMQFKNSTVTIKDSSGIANTVCDAGAAKGMIFDNTIAYVTDCYTNSGHTGIAVVKTSKVYITGGTIGGYSHGLYCTHSPEGEVFVNDAILRSYDNSDIDLCYNNNPDRGVSCCYVGYDKNAECTVYFDGCTFTTGSNLDHSHAMVLRGSTNAANPTTVNMSNCKIDLGHQKVIRIEDGTRERYSAVNVGINTVDASGNPITRDNVWDEDTDGWASDSNPDLLCITGLLYRRHGSESPVSAKDYRAYYDYLMSLSGQQ